MAVLGTTGLLIVHGLMLLCVDGSWVRRRRQQEQPTRSHDPSKCVDLWNDCCVLSVQNAFCKDGYEIVWNNPKRCAGTSYSCFPPHSPGTTTTTTQTVIFSQPTAEWILVASGADISQSVQAGFSYGGSTQTTRTNGLGHSVAGAASGGINVPFFDGTISITMSASYSHTWSNSVTQTASRSSSDTCATNCAHGRLPANATFWRLYQWSMGALSSDGNKMVVKSCSFVCVPVFPGVSPIAPVAPLGCCDNAQCDKFRPTADCARSGLRRV